jgi:hypothetical protein
LAVLTAANWAEMKFAIICHPAKFKYNQKICNAKRVGETAQNFRYQGETAKKHCRGKNNEGRSL